MSYVMGGRVLWWVGEGCGGESCGQWGAVTVVRWDCGNAR